MITSDEIRVEVSLVMTLDADDVPTEHQDELGLRSIVEEVINAGIYDVPGAAITKLKIDIEGIE